MVYSLLVFDIAIERESQGLYMCARPHAASNREWRLFHSTRPEVRRQFESSD